MGALLLSGIAVVLAPAVSKHTTSIFAKLDLASAGDDNRRVLAVLAYLNS